MLGDKLAPTRCSLGIRFTFEGGISSPAKCETIEESVCLEPGLWALVARTDSILNSGAAQKKKEPTCQDFLQIYYKTGTKHVDCLF